MKQIKYNDTTSIRLEIPPEWDMTNISDVNCEIRDTDGNVLQAASAADMTGSSTLNGAVSSGGVTITTADDRALVPGDRVLVLGGMPETRTVQSYVVATKTATFTTVLDYDHVTAAPVYFMWATIDVVTTTVATWPKNKQLVIAWIPLGITVAPYTERAEIAEVGEFSASDFDEQFEMIYSREYETFRDRLDTVREVSERKLSYRLQSRGLNIERVVDQEVLMDTLLSLTRYNLIKGSGDDWEFEIKTALNDYNTDFEVLCSLAIWADDNQDEKQGDDETKSFQPSFIERNM